MSIFHTYYRTRTATIQPSLLAKSTVNTIENSAYCFAATAIYGAATHASSAHLMAIIGSGALPGLAFCVLHAMIFYASAQITAYTYSKTANPNKLGQKMGFLVAALTSIVAGAFLLSSYHAGLFHLIPALATQELLFPHLLAFSCFMIAAMDLACSRLVHNSMRRNSSKSIWWPRLKLLIASYWHLFTTRKETPRSAPTTTSSRSAKRNSTSNPTMNKTNQDNSLQETTSCSPLINTGVDTTISTATPIECPVNIEQLIVELCSDDITQLQKKADFFTGLVQTAQNKPVEFAWDDNALGIAGWENMSTQTQISTMPHSETTPLLKNTKQEINLKKFALDLNVHFMSLYNENKSYDEITTQITNQRSGILSFLQTEKTGWKFTLSHTLTEQLNTIKQNWKKIPLYSKLVLFLRMGVPVLSADKLSSPLLAAIAKED